MLYVDQGSSYPLPATDSEFFFKVDGKEGLWFSPYKHDRDPSNWSHDADFPWKVRYDAEPERKRLMAFVATGEIADTLRENPHLAVAVKAWEDWAHDKWDEPQWRVSGDKDE